MCSKSIINYIITTKKHLKNFKNDRRMFSLLESFPIVLLSLFLNNHCWESMSFFWHGYFNPGCGSTSQSIPSIPNEPNWTQATHHKSLQRSWKKNNCFLFFESFTSCDMELWMIRLKMDMINTNHFPLLEIKGFNVPNKKRLLSRSWLSLVS